MWRPGFTASAQPASARDPSGFRKLWQPWQQEALAYYDQIGECAYPANSFANVFGKIRFFPAILNERNEPEEVEDGPLIDLWGRVKDKTGGQTELQETYGRLQFLIGDGYLTVSESDGQEVWEYLSPVELRVTDDGDYVRVRAPGLTQEELIEASDEAFGPLEGNSVRVWRLWNRHPTYSQWSTSSIRSVIDLYGLLLRLTQASNAEAMSRAATRGLVYIPEELDFGGAETTLDEDPQQDPFMQEWDELMTKSLKEPGTAAAAAAVAIRGPAVLEAANQSFAMKDLIGHIPVGPTDGYQEAEMWDKTVRRIAFGTLLPPEFITGAGEMNHWSGWLVDEQFFRMHFTPAAQRYAGDVAGAYLRPAALDEGIPDADRVTVAFDPEAAISHPDEFKTALEMHKALVVSDEYLRDKGGATEQAAPAEDELDRRIAVMLKDLPRALGEEPEEGETAPQDGGTGGDTDETPPDQPPRVRNGNGRPQEAVAAMVLGAAELAVERTRELAGNRLKGRAQHCDECRKRMEGSPPALIAANLGALVVGDLISGQIRESSLVAGGARPFRDTVQKWGVEQEWAEELEQQIESHALRTLYEQQPPPMPAGFHTLVARATR